MKKFKAFKKDDKVWAQAINPYSSFWETRQYVYFENVNPPILCPSLTDGEVYNEEDLEFGLSDEYPHLVEPFPIQSICVLKQQKEAESAKMRKYLLTDEAAEKLLEKHPNLIKHFIINPSISEQITEQPSSTEKEESVKDDETPERILSNITHLALYDIKKGVKITSITAIMAMDEYATYQKQQTQKDIDALVEKLERQRDNGTFDEAAYYNTFISDLKNLSK